ncbi:MAG: acyl-ACP--UDP-N-acetylglucosamine O-acyltransferase [Akkermansiaceae bacterium]|nr:acyl-ACP--UDP-N-acetylglucosamine O-acyltransferase [Armatimonadota bacterium]
MTASNRETTICFAAGREFSVTSNIHPTAVIDPETEIGNDVSIGAYSVIGANCVIGDNTVIGPHVVIEEHTHIGKECTIRSGAVLGGLPQDLKFKGERSYVRVGDRNMIREFVTIHRATGAEQATSVGDDNLIMAYVHIGHNCAIANRTMISSYAGLSGHISVEEGVVIGGMVGVHQFVRIGKLAMLGGYSKVVQDVPPFMLADGRPADILDLNVRGLRRSGLNAGSRANLKQAYKLLYRSNLNQSQALEAIEDEIEPEEAITYLVSFVKNISNGSSGRQLDKPRL